MNDVIVRLRDKDDKAACGHARQIGAESAKSDEYLSLIPEFAGLYDLILDTAQKDERIRAVTMEGSNSCALDVRDKYSDFDITFFVSDIREFTADKKYMERFGEILIMQCPDDEY